MKNFGFIFLFSFAAIQLSAQNFFHDKYGYYDSGHYGYGIAGGIFQADFKSINNHMHTLGAKEDFGSSYYAAGFTAGIPMGGRYGESNATISIEAFLPKTVDVNDSVHFRFNGFHIMTYGWEKDLFPDTAFDCIVSTGIDWGMAYYKERNPMGAADYHNFFISPLARVEFHYVIKWFEVGVRATYRYDITAHHWKNDVDGNPLYRGAGFSGLGFEVFVAKIRLHADGHNTENQYAPPVEDHR